jgi:hypothetical protein
MEQRRYVGLARAPWRLWQPSRANAAHRALDLAGTVAAIRANGATSLQAVSDELNRQGMTTARGGRWHAATVQRLEMRARSA